jgi:hypothetical protein
MPSWEGILMISPKMMQEVQSCADRLTNDLIAVLHTNPRCPAYRGLPTDRLIELKDDLYRNLGRWLNSRSKAAVEARYLKLGRERYLARIPLSEVIFAQSVTKSFLLDFIRRSMPGDSEDAGMEHELVHAISEFFDEVLSWVAAGYEDAGRAEAENPVEEAGTSSWFPDSKGDPAPAGALQAVVDELPVSRGGDVGETSG